MKMRGLWPGTILLLGLSCGLPALHAQGPQGSSFLPAPFPPLQPEYEQFLDQVLTLWQQRSQAVERYRCTFQRWEYDPVFGPRDSFKTYSEGVIKFAAPDKGLFKVERIMEYAAPAQPGGKPQFVQREGELGEHWICDGKSVYEHDHKNKQLIQRELPPAMHGTAIADGPLPFLFGADAARIKQRYWIRPLPMPKDVEGEYWLEAFPKTRQDAANYLKVHVIIDHQDFLPKGLVIFDRNFDEARNPARTTFTFQKREVNWSLALQQLKFWHRAFYEPEIPAGWKKVVERYESLPLEDYAPAAPATGAVQTTRSTAAPTPR
jgi:TIGR03009 family protein